MQIRNELSGNFFINFGEWKSWRKILFIAKKISGIIYIKISTFELIGFLKNGLYCFLMDELMLFACNFQLLFEQSSQRSCHDNFRSNFRTIAELDRLYTFCTRHPIFPCVANKKLSSRLFSLIFELNAKVIFNSNPVWNVALTIFHTIS